MRWVLLLSVLVAAALGEDNCPKIISRSQWGAQRAKTIEYIIKPAKYVILQHTAGNICKSQEACAETVRDIQAYHMDELDFGDIGYSFLVGGDGNVYEGRGWHKKGAHTRSYNSKSIGIALIGDFTDNLPPRVQLDALKQLLMCGVEIDELSDDFKLLAHLQVSNTKSPGYALYQEIQTWPEWSSIV